jgi:hypothetical protein
MGINYCRKCIGGGHGFNIYCGENWSESGRIQCDECKLKDEMDTLKKENEQLKSKINGIN